jgi:hypothetical protein
VRGAGTLNGGRRLIGLYPAAAVNALWGQPIFGDLVREAMRVAVRPRLPDFSVVVWLRKTNKFATLKAELLGAAVTEPYESTEYQGMVDFHWSAANLAEAKRLAEALKGVAQLPELVLLHIMSRIDGVDSISIKDERQRRH